MLFKYPLILSLGVRVLALPQNPASTASCAAIPSTISTNNAKLPDPFLPVTGGPRISTKAEWACRREEIKALFQQYEFGPKPPRPSSVTSTFASNKLTINISEGGKSTSFAVTIQYPSSGKAPYPAIIGYSGGNIPIPNNVARITFNSDEIADQYTRGKGKFFDIYGKDHKAGSLIAWAWGVSRIIDALETTPSANINPQRLGVTGCSRYGKAAFIAGAFDERMALTLPQEGGSGGPGCWRISDQMKKDGTNVETAAQIVTGDVWFAEAFTPWTKNIPTTPYDHHMLAGLVAPRGLLVIENTAIDYLGPLSNYGCMKTGQKIYQALGVTDSMGFSQNSHSAHCSFPSAQQPELTAFIQRFLLDQTMSTNVMKTDGKFTFDEARWVDWTVPTLS
ncbi:carbohydrate esterase family 15 protein [Patellaria atrata CBS 101060]|uniref:(4-O-methyl)-D-glucuronate--lignin esterase n=1 Tax=Patellaria atrata CBS 101060 TaxID=1346257 RepID=A0A9P4S5D9_9PEZI|nr:carbohydrate esterase family 15 protein [Patellaria atrata CBS 101060]